MVHTIQYKLYMRGSNQRRETAEYDRCPLLSITRRATLEQEEKNRTGSLRTSDKPTLMSTLRRSMHPWTSVSKM